MDIVEHEVDEAVPEGVVFETEADENAVPSSRYKIDG